MKKNTVISIICFLLIFYSCSKQNEMISYETGVYKPYKQVISPISAMTKNGIVDGSQIKVNGATGGNFGDIHFSDLNQNSDPLRQPVITIDSIYFTEIGEAHIYPNTFNFPPQKIERVKDNLFLKSPHSGVVVKFSPCCLMPVIITDHKEAELYTTQKGKFLESGFVLFSYNIYVKSSSGSYGTDNSNYLDLDFLKKELRNDDTLVYVKKETYFKKN